MRSQLPQLQPVAVVDCEADALMGFVAVRTCVVAAAAAAAAGQPHMVGHVELTAIPNMAVLQLAGVNEAQSA